ncbi:hypothetical protein ebA6720 [Aromatoleum aromaticum EbN1]|uniref:Uncharacterized protein n=1 Tax=Aromatoleum aromaticum (strain DSM 19018 / LMG 30748 / EbN1) TaxID=76114 RepID=Q5NY94_AROAE|nr:hypothetical protein ebA6720 [Aromatoleum aromaticum EbN1]
MPTSCEPVCPPKDSSGQQNVVSQTVINILQKWPAREQATSVLGVPCGGATDDKDVCVSVQGGDRGYAKRQFVRESLPCIRVSLDPC